MSNLATVEAMIAAYNAHEPDTYVTYVTDDCCQGNYRGAVMRDGKEAIRAGLKAGFEQFPDMRGEVVSLVAVGNYVVLHEKVAHPPHPDPLELVSVYSFDGDKCCRVEFIR